MHVAAKSVDYFSILTEAIHNTTLNSAQLRALVYERARFHLKREILFGNSSLGVAELVRHIDALELAIARIETNAVDTPQIAMPEQRAPQYQKSEPTTAPGNTDPPKATTIAENTPTSKSARSPESTTTSESAVESCNPF